MATNQDLHALYEQGYAAGNKWHTPVDTWEESLLIHQIGGDWRNRCVLEIGCGEGRLAALIAMSGAYHVDAVDYSPSAIATANARYQLPNLRYVAGTLADIADHYDVIAMQGVLEHTDDWSVRLHEYAANYLYPHSQIITSSPSFLNPRGYVWQTLRLLFNVPMSLSDLHSINPFDMQSFCGDNGWTCEYQSCHHDWAAGATLLADYERRLPNALRDAGLDTSHVPALLSWLDQASRHYVPTDWSGATVVYRITPAPHDQLPALPDATLPHV